MRGFTFLVLTAAAVSIDAAAVVANNRRDFQLFPYAPVPAFCPSGPLVRPATSLSDAETSYVKARKAKADESLAAWLKSLNAGLPTANLPIVGFTVSGGGYRSLLEGAGVMQAFDARDGAFKTSGLYQAFTYQAGLSGGGWFTASVAGNNYPTITQLRTTIWEQAFQNSPLLPGGAFFALNVAAVTADLAEKKAAGFPNTLVDAFGRLVSFTLLSGFDGGVGKRLSSITGFSNFTSFNAPYPIITALGVQASKGEYIPAKGGNSTQYEFHPYEIGSWDAGVSAFMRTPYIGTLMNNGNPASALCTKSYDNLGYIAGTTSNVFNNLAIGSTGDASGNELVQLAQALEMFVGINNATNGSAYPTELFALYRNPFAGYARSSLVSAQAQLTLVDGGESLQNNPIWPFIQKTKRADVLLVSDNSADTSANYPDGSEIQTTYLRAQQAGLSRMPFIPSPQTFLAKGLNRKATFFGCDDADKLTIVYLPNTNYTYNSGQSTFKLQYSVAETRAMIANGVQIGLQNGAADWPTCLGCATVKKTGQTLPAVCSTCFQKYCYRT